MHRVHLAIFAAAHGVAAESVSAFPQSVTAQMIDNFKSSQRDDDELLAAGRITGDTWRDRYQARQDDPSELPKLLAALDAATEPTWDATAQLLADESLNTRVRRAVTDAGDDLRRALTVRRRYVIQQGLGLPSPI